MSSHSWFSAPFVAASLIVAAPSEAPAQTQATPFSSPSAKAAHSAATLIAGDSPQDGVYAAALRLSLDPGTVTYWRQPGDAGSPPVFDFSGSDNVAGVEVLYPAPKHIREADSVVAGYDRDVVFPLMVTARDRASPVALKLTMDYAACGKICLPARAELSLALPASAESPFKAEIAAAQASVPRRLSEAQARAAFALEQKRADLWTVSYKGPGVARDLFAEAPEPYFIDVLKGEAPGAFDLHLIATPSAVKPGAGLPDPSLTATVTALTESGAIEARLRLR